MKIISQIDESTFVVRMEDSDLPNQPQHIFVAHDYLSVSGIHGISNDMSNGIPKLYGKFVSCGNVVIQQNVHVSIRPMIELVMPYLQEHPNMQKEHLFHKDGRPAYNYSGVDLVLHGDERYTKQADGTGLWERDVWHYKSALIEGSFSYENYYDVTKTTYSQLLVSGSGWEELPTKEESYKQYHIKLNNE